MNKTSKISVIVPVYKVELYLRQCIDSIITQSYTNLEIILVDDGSPDNCGKICGEYEKNHSRIKVIHKKNGGLSDARNAGIDICSGEYLTFVDSDDWIETDMIETLYNNLVNHDADISCCGYFLTYINSKEITENTSEIIVLNKEQAIEQMLLDNIGKVSVMAWGKLYKKYIFNKIRYPLGRIHEDEFVITDILSETNIVVSDTNPKYYYRQRKSSITGINSYNSKKMNDLIEASELKLKITEQKYTNMCNIAKIQLLNTMLSVFRQLIVTKNYREKYEYKKILFILRKNYRFIITNNYSLKRKVIFTLLKINAGLYRILFLIRNWKNLNKSTNYILFE
jgi:glycosyltransferase involved in cell wall biosynthesis